MSEFETKTISSFAEVSSARVAVRFLGDDRAYYICNDAVCRTLFSLSGDELHQKFCSWTEGIKKLSAASKVRIKTRYNIYLPGYTITDMQFLQDENATKQIERFKEFVRSSGVIKFRPTKIICNKDSFALSYRDLNPEKTEETTYCARRGCVSCYERLGPIVARRLAFDDVLDFLVKDECRYTSFEIGVKCGLIESITIDRTAVIKEITDFKITAITRIDDNLRRINGDNGLNYILTHETIFTELTDWDKKTVTINQFLHRYETWLGAFKVDKIVYEVIEGDVASVQFVKEIVYMHEPKKIYISTGRAYGKAQAYELALNALYGSSPHLRFMEYDGPFKDSTTWSYCKADEKEKEEMNKFLVPKIEKVLFEDPATIVFWKDGTKTVVRAQDGEKFDREKGLAMAISKKALGNDRGYYFTFQRYKAVDKPVTKKKPVKTAETPKKAATKKTKKG